MEGSCLQSVSIGELGRILAVWRCARKRCRPVHSLSFFSHPTFREELAVQAFDFIGLLHTSLFTRSQAPTEEPVRRFESEGDATSSGEAIAVHVICRELNATGGGKLDGIIGRCSLLLEESP